MACSGYCNHESEAPWPSHLLIDLKNLKLVSNYSDRDAAILLGELEGEENLAKRFKKGQGPRSPACLDIDGKIMAGEALTWSNHLKQEQDAEAALVVEPDRVDDTIIQNAKNRKRQAALVALSKRAPKRKARISGCFVTLDGTQAISNGEEEVEEKKEELEQVEE